ncbi:MAG TPA: amidase [Xanthobacteraceae bacterium]|nr:amidase [Xanthobacteraceae bacterium]
MTDESLLALSAAAAAEELRRGAFSAETYARAWLAAAEAREKDVRAFIHFDPAHVLAQARALDERREAGAPLGALHGLPVGVKDIIDTADYPTENGAALYAGRRPTRDATAVARLRAAGAVVFAKTVTTEVAFRHPGATRNPHDLTRTPGGSSSGSAAAVAAGMLPLAIGSQTAGSVIRPAAFCGVIGVKPTHGLISRAGVMLLSRKLDHLGVFARTVPDAALLIDALAGYDPEDVDTRPFAAPNLAAAAVMPSAPSRLAFVRTPMWEKADAEARAALETFVAALGPRAQPLDLPDWFGAGWEAHRAVMAADMAHRHGPLVDRMPEKASAPLRAMVEEGRAVSAVRYLDALALAERMTRSLKEILASFDAIVTPAAPGVAPKGLGFTGDPVFNALWTFTGLPAVTLPLLKGEAGLPLGVQLVGAPGEDARVLSIAQWFMMRGRQGKPH